MMRVANDPVKSVQHDPYVSLQHKPFTRLILSAVFTSVLMLLSQLLIRDYEQEIKALKLELAMHDTLVSRV